MAYAQYSTAKKNEILQNTQQSYYDKWAEQLNAFNQWGDSKAGSLNQYGNTLFGGMNGGSYTDFLNWTQQPVQDYQQANLNTATYAPFYSNAVQYYSSRDRPSTSSVVGWGPYIDFMEPFVGTNAKDWVGAHGGNDSTDDWLKANTPYYVPRSTGVWGLDYSGYGDMRDFFGSDGDLDRTDLTNAYNWLNNQFDALQGHMETRPSIPSFTNSIMGFDSTPLSLSLPNYADYTGDKYRQGLLDPYSSALSWYDNFANQLTEDKTGLQNRYDSLASQYGGFQSALRGIDVNNIDSYGQDLRQQIEQARQGIGNYTNDFYKWLQANDQAFNLNDGRTFASARNALRDDFGNLLEQLDTIGADREAQLAAYNSFRNTMRGNLRTLDDELGGFGLMDWYNQGDGIRDQIRDFRSQIEGYETDLNDVNFSTSLGLLSDLTQQSNRLQSDFDTEFNRYETNRNEWRTNLANLKSALQGTDWYERNMLDNTFAQARNIGNQIDNYDSEIASLFDFSRSRGLLDAIQQEYDQKDQLYQDEEARIAGFRGERRDELEALLQQVGLLNPEQFVTAGEQADQYGDQLNDIARMLRDFESKLNPTFDVSQNLIGDIRGELGDARLEMARNQNEFDSRISDVGYDVGDLQRLWASLQSGDDNLDYRRRNNLDSYQGLLDNFGTERGSLDSTLQRLIQDAQALGYNPESINRLQDDFGAMANTDQFQAALDEMMNQRNTELDAMFGRLSDFRTQAQGLNDYDEQGFLDLINELSGLQNDALGFSGGRVDDLTADTSSLFDELEGGLTGLYDSRDDLEAEAKNLLSQFSDRQYYNTGIIDSDRALLDDLLGRIDQYGAEQARDEYRAMDSRLLAELQRIERDREQARAAQEEERRRLEQGNMGVSDAELAYLANWLRNRDRDDTYNYANNAFAQAFGLGG